MSLKLYLALNPNLTADEFQQARDQVDESRERILEKLKESAKTIDDPDVRLQFIADQMGMIVRMGML